MFLTVSTDKMTTGELENELHRLTVERQRLEIVITSVRKRLERLVVADKQGGLFDGTQD